MWPLSREHFPKQLLPLVNDTSLLQDTILRLDGLDGLTSTGEKVQIESPVVVCNEEHRFLIAEQLRQINRIAKAIILEPLGRNTAPALTLGALACQDQGKIVLLVMPADHVIGNVNEFQRVILEAMKLAADKGFVTMGIVPTGPETGYGYIQKGEQCQGTEAYTLKQFVEKPDKAVAQMYLDSGEYYWNSGLFMMSVETWLNAIEKYQPDIHAACIKSYEDGYRDMDFLRVSKESFTACPSNSIDYAVAEKITADSDYQSVVVPMDVAWSDVGAWSALWEVNEPDSNGNVVSGDTCTINCTNSLIKAESRLVAAVGIKDMVIAETADAVLVAHKDSSQDVKKVTEWLKAAGRQEHVMHRRVYRPWGWYESMDYGERFQVKRIGVNPGAALSMQMHHHRAEHWIVVKGTAKVTRGDEVAVLSENESTYIPLGVKHRLENPGKMDLEIIEVQSGSYLGEDDIVRFEDQYGR